MMKPMKKLLALAVSCCMLAGLLPYPFAAAADGPSVRVSTETELKRVLENAVDGMTIQMAAPIAIRNTVSDDSPLAISKEVTIDGGGYNLTLWYGGIILGADVTLKNVTLALADTAYYGIYANGHTLTLENVWQSKSTSSVGLFCGSLEGTTYTLPAMGTHGTIVVKGTTNLGNLYAGSQFPRLEDQPTGAPAVYHGPSSIYIDSSATRSMGDIYASGAAKVGTGTPPPTADPALYPVNGEVDITLYRNVCGYVDGTASDTNRASVSYRGNSTPGAPLLYNIKELSVESGFLRPAQGSQEDFPAVSVAPGARVAFNDLRSPVIDAFTGGGELLLGKEQTLEIRGTVLGQTKFAVDTFQEDGSSGTAEPGHIYIQAEDSEEESFSFQPNASQSYLSLVYDSVSGSWTVEGEAPAVQIESLSVEDLVEVTPEVDEVEVAVPIEVVADAGAGTLAQIQMELMVNGEPATYEEVEGLDGSDPYYFVESLGLCIFFTYGDNTTDCLVMFKGDRSDIEANRELPAPGVYRITLTVPAEYSTSGQAITAVTDLVVKGETSDLLPVPVPTAIEGLVENGEEQTGVPEGAGYRITGNTAVDAGTYTAIATLESGYIWSDGTEEDQEIRWSIAEAEVTEPTVQDAPTGLSGREPDRAGGEGWIMGTFAEMEYASSPDASRWTDCEDGGTAVQPGTYYVRFRADEENHLAESPAVEVVVPEYSGSALEPIVPEAPVGLDGVAPEYAGGAGSIQGTTTEMEYASAEDLSVWLPCTGGGTAVQPGVYYVRYIAVPDDNLAASSAVMVIVFDYGTSGELYQVTIHGSHAEISGAGSYPEGMTVSIDAGDYENHTFAGWSTEDVELSEPDSAQTSFTMPAGPVSLTANWTADSIPEPPEPELPERPSRPTVPDMPEIPTGRPNRGPGSGFTGGGSASSDAKNPDETPVQDPGASSDPTAAWRNPFGDVPAGEWYYSAVAYVCQNQLMSGMGDGSFVPEAPMTRGQLVSILYRLAGSPAVSGALPFPDADDSAYYADAVRWAIQSGITSGYSNGDFGPNDPVTNEQLCTFFYRYAQHSGVDTTASTEVLTRFADRDTISSFAAEPIAWATGRGILSGNTRQQILPLSQSTRAQAAAILMRYQTGQN